ncbi:hypothetical protein COY27_04325 [Candidatus Woesearchaeota archaeon CG_4_10_14_0_2_um_filter_33_13]|nr:MAG: hypothetical protein COY27_04325 [Candidatus Woesearchaeota archaeon CG_4_10_14_0_2_um_filter_33_13]
MMKKKGITPIMATILLISFAVALGVVIMSFGQAQVEESAQCPIDINLKLSTIGGEDQLCYDSISKEVRFTLENGVNIKVEGLVFNIIGSVEAKSYELNDAKIGKAGNYMGKVSYDATSSGEIKQIKVTPIINLYDEEQVCAEKALVVETIKAC